MASALAGVGVGVGLGLGYGVLNEYARLGIMYAKWKALKGNARDRIAECLQALCSAEKDEVTGLSTKGQVDTIVDFIDKTMDLAVVIDEGIAVQMFVQMIQQSIAYAIHSSHAGSIGTVGNVYSGSMYLSGAEASNIGESIEFMSRGLRGFISAEVGQNIPTLAFNLLRGANRRIEDVYRSITRQMDTFLDEWNDLTLSYYRHYHSMCRERFADAIKMKETVTDRAYGLLEQIANEHLARMVEQYDSLEGAKSWFDGTLMGADELGNIALRIGLEVDASIKDYEEHKEAVLDAIDTAVEEWDAKIDQALSDLTDAEYRFCLLIRTVFDEVFVDVAEFVQQIISMCDNAVEDVCAYRNVKRAVDIKEHDPVTTVEAKPEIDITRLYNRRFAQVSESIIVTEYTYYSGVVWDSVEWVEPVVVEVKPYTTVPKEKWVQVVPDIIVGEYTYHPITSWVSVG